MQNVIPVSLAQGQGYRGICGKRNFPQAPFERYADDGMIHCRTREEELSKFDFLAREKAKRYNIHIRAEDSMKEGKSQKNFKISIRAKILTGMIACVLIVTNLIGWFFIVQAKDTLLEQCKKNARNSAKIAAERIDGDILG